MITLSTWALVAIVAVSHDDKRQEEYLVNGIPLEVQRVIHDHSELFDTPTSLPPSRAFDHAISLYPRSTAVNCRPYRYAPHQKDEIERQVSSML
jgi:hypothetical protein